MVACHRDSKAGCGKRRRKRLEDLLPAGEGYLTEEKEIAPNGVELSHIQPNRQRGSKKWEIGD